MKKEEKRKAIPKGITRRVLEALNEIEHDHSTEFFEVLF
jgi:hypothetical protein